MHPEAWLPSGSTEIWMDERMANIKTSETQDASALHSVLWVQILPFPLVSYKVLSGRQIGVRNTPWLPVSQLISGVQCSDSSCFHKILRGFVSWPITDFNNFLYTRKHAAPSHLGKVTWERCTMSLPWEESSVEPECRVTGSLYLDASVQRPALKPTSSGSSLTDFLPWSEVKSCSVLEISNHESMPRTQQDRARAETSAEICQQAAPAEEQEAYSPGEAPPQSHCT